MSDQNISIAISLEEYHLLQILLDKEYMTAMTLKNQNPMIYADVRIKLITDLQDKLYVSHEVVHDAMVAEQKRAERHEMERNLDEQQLEITEDDAWAGYSIGILVRGPKE